MVAVVGLGNMGMAMLAHLRAGGIAVSAWDLDPAKRAAAAGLGATAPDAIEDLDAGVLVLSLPHAKATEAVLAALLPRLKAGAVIADTSTLDPIAVRGFAARCAAAGVDYLDTPVSGGPAGAAAGTLAMMVGGEAAALDRARPVLDRLAARIVHVGASGAGQVAKLVNNLLVATNLVTAAEALRMGAKAGVAPETLVQVINAATGRSAATEVNFPRWILSGAFDSGFTAGLMRKDVRLALDLAAAVGAPLDATARAAANWEALSGTVPDGEEFNRLAAAILEGDAA